MSTLKEINFDLDEISMEVESVYVKYTPQKSRAYESDRDNNDLRNYHPPLD